MRCKTFAVISVFFLFICFLSAATINLPADYATIQKGDDDPDGGGS